MSVSVGSDVKVDVWSGREVGSAVVSGGKSVVVEPGKVDLGWVQVVQDKYRVLGKLNSDVPGKRIREDVSCDTSREGLGGMVAPEDDDGSAVGIESRTEDVDNEVAAGEYGYPDAGEVVTTGRSGGPEGIGSRCCQDLGESALETVDPSVGEAEYVAGQLVAASPVVLATDGTRSAPSGSLRKENVGVAAAGTFL